MHLYILIQDDNILYQVCNILYQIVSDKSIENRELIQARIFEGCHLHSLQHHAIQQKHNIAVSTAVKDYVIANCLQKINK